MPQSGQTQTVSIEMTASANSVFNLRQAGGTPFRFWEVPYNIVDENKRLQAQIAQLKSKSSNALDVRSAYALLEDYITSADLYWGIGDAESEISRTRLALSLADWRSNALDALLTQDEEMAESAIHDVVRQAARIEVKASARGLLPISFLPIGQSPLMFTTDPRRTLFATALLLPAFCAINVFVRWASGGNVPAPHKISAEGNAEVNLFLRSEKTRMWPSALATLNGLQETASAIIGPTLGFLDSPMRLARQLLTPDAVTTRDGRVTAPRVVIFYAHGIQGATLGDEFVAEFAFSKRWRFRKTTFQVRTADVNRARRERATLSEPEPAPIVFFSSCWSGGSIGEEGSSVPQIISSCGGVAVAPHLPVTERMARLMMHFYIGSLKAGLDTDESMLAARLLLLRAELSPLGLLYSIY